MVRIKGLKRESSHFRGAELSYEDKLVAEMGTAILSVAAKITHSSSLPPPLQVDPLELQEAGRAVFEQGFK